MKKYIILLLVFFTTLPSFAYMADKANCSFNRQNSNIAAKKSAKNWTKLINLLESNNIRYYRNDETYLSPSGVETYGPIKVKFYVNRAMKARKHPIYVVGRLQGSISLPPCMMDDYRGEYGLYGFGFGDLVKVTQSSFVSLPSNIGRHEPYHMKAEYKNLGGAKIADYIVVPFESFYGKSDAVLDKFQRYVTQFGRI